MIRNFGRKDERLYRNMSDARIPTGEDVKLIPREIAPIREFYGWEKESARTGRIIGVPDRNQI